MKRRKMPAAVLAIVTAAVTAVSCNEGLTDSKEAQLDGPRFDYDWPFNCDYGTCSSAFTNPAFYAESNRLIGHNNPLCQAIGNALGSMLDADYLGIRAEGAYGNVTGRFNNFYDEFVFIPSGGEDYTVVPADQGAWIAAGTTSEMVNTARHEAAHALLYNNPNGSQHQLADYPHHGAMTAAAASSTCR